MPHPPFIGIHGVPRSDGPIEPTRVVEGPLVRGALVAKVELAVRAIHASPDTAWTVESLAEVAKMSRSVFAQQFHLAAGVPPGKFLLDCRMRSACELLRNRSLGIKEIAARVGYGSESSFGNAFRRWAGKPPGVFRASRQGLVKGVLPG